MEERNRKRIKSRYRSLTLESRSYFFADELFVEEKFFLNSTHATLRDVRDEIFSLVEKDKEENIRS